jgi:hypothetical protein
MRLGCRCRGAAETLKHNVVPYLGSIVALVAGLAYVFLGTEFHPLLPMVEQDSFAVWVVLAVLLAELIKKRSTNRSCSGRGAAPPCRRDHRVRRRYTHVWRCRSHPCGTYAHGLYSLCFEHSSAFKGVWAHVIESHRPNGGCLRGLRQRCRALVSEGKD